MKLYYLYQIYYVNQLGNGTCDIFVGQAGYVYYRYKMGVNFGSAMNEAAFRIQYKLPGNFTVGVWMLIVL